MIYRRRLFEYLKYENKPILVLLFLVCVLSMTFSIAVPKLQGDLINSVELESISIFKIIFVISLSFIAIFLTSVASVLPAFLMLKFQNKVKSSLMESVQYVSESFLSMAGASGLYYGFGNISNDISFVAYPAILNIVLSILQSIAALFFLSKIYLKLFHFSLAAICIYIFLVLLSKKTYAYYVKKLREKEPILYENAHMIFSSARTITQFGNPTFFFDKFGEKLIEIKHLKEKADNFIQAQKTMLDVLKAVSFVSFVLILRKGIFEGTIATGSMVLILSYIPLLLQPLEKIQFFLKIRGWISESETNYEEYKQEVYKVPLSQFNANLDLNCEVPVKVDNICFSYEEEDNG